MAEWDPERVSELSGDQIEALFSQLAETDFEEDYDILAAETLGEGRFPVRNDTRGYAVETEWGEYQILGVPFEEVTSHEANIVLIFLEDRPEKLYSSVVEDVEVDGLSVSRIRVIGGAIAKHTLRVDFAALGSLPDFQSPWSPDKCEGCKKMVAAAKYTGCGVAPAVICGLAGVPPLPSISCDAIGLIVCHELQKDSNLSRQKVCEKIGLCPP